MSVNPEFLPQSKPVDAIGRTLLEAAEIIRKHGWHKGGCRGFNGEVCAGMAISIAAEGVERPSGFLLHPTAIAAEKRLMSHTHGDELPGWNDASGRTAEEVIHALEQAALLP